jgi:predicted Rossmann-fold nucleotide-binding protein
LLPAPRNHSWHAQQAAIHWLRWCILGSETMKEIETLEELEAHLASFHDLADTVIQGVDLSSHGSTLLRVGLAGATFLGCQLDESVLRAALGAGALVFPTLPDVPYAPYRGLLYSVDELYAGFDPARPESYAHTLDARIYQHFLRTGGPKPANILETLARRLHDHAVTDAMRDLLYDVRQPRRIVAIMGGHGMPRGSAEYVQVARIARALAERGYFMVSGGGPGAMEATHLGVWFAGRAEKEMAQGLEVLARAPTFDHPEWLSRAFEVRERLPAAELPPSLGVPTWLYGHEPPNAFASHVAKYFANSVREDGLLTIATSGVIFAPGSAGTIQEIFQDACQNHYKTVGVVSPMVFLGEAFWKWKSPVFPLLSQLAAGREYAQYLSITDRDAEVVRVIEDYAALNPPPSFP